MAQQEKKTIESLKIKIQRWIYGLNLDADTVFFALTLLVGFGSGLLAVFMKQSIHFIVGLCETTKSPSFESTILGLTFVLVSIFLTLRYFPSSGGSGIPNLKLALVAHNGRIYFKEWFSKLIVSILSLSSGMVLGREGPTVSITAGLGSSLGRLFSLSQSKIKSLVAVGTAGGLAAAFNTPIAAVIFTLEEVVGNLNAKVLGPIVIAAVTASVTGHALHGGESMFTILKYKLDKPDQLPYFIVVGLACAFIGPLWVKFLLLYRSFAKKYLFKYRVFLVFFSFLALTSLAYITPMVLGSGEHIINLALHSKLGAIQLVAFLLIVKFIMTTVFYSTGISGGLFMPVLYMGAMTGALIGLLASYASLDSLAVGAYALVGMGAFFASVIRAPFTSIIMIFELTQDYRVILPLMLANITSYLVSQRFSSGSVYEQISEQDGVHLPQKEDNEVLDQMTVLEAMVTDVDTLNHELKIKDALTYIRKSDFSGFPVMRNGFIYGVTSVPDIGKAYARGEGESLVSSIAVKKIYNIYPDQSLLLAFHYLKKYRVSRLLVVSRLNDKRLLGIITAEDIVNRFGYHIQDETESIKIDEYLEKQHPESSTTN